MLFLITLCATDSARQFFMTIGERIRELRHKNHLTQENLAEALQISYQAVSKWENNTANPDITMIGPITRIFHITADELLGLTDTDEKKAEYDAAYANYPKVENWEESYHIAAEALRDFPEDFRYLEWLATCEYQIAWKEGHLPPENFSEEYFSEQIENAIRHYDKVIENCQIPKIRDRAHIGMVKTLKLCGRNEEALWYAEIYPDDERDMTRADVLKLCEEED